MLEKGDADLVKEPKNLKEEEYYCPKCHSSKIWGNGHYLNPDKKVVRRYKCGDCSYKGRSWLKGVIKSGNLPPEGSGRAHIQLEETEDVCILTTKSMFIRTAEEALLASRIDTKIWMIDRKLINYWTVTVGAGNSGTETPETYTNYQVKVWLKRKVVGFNPDLLRIELMKEMKSLSIKVPKLPYEPQRKLCDQNALEINIFDLHLGKLAWEKETGIANYDIKLALDSFFTALNYLVKRAQLLGHIEEIVFPIGNDFFNSDTSFPFTQTTKGTPQQDDSRWQKIFTKGRLAIYDAIDLLKHIAPVKVYVVSGNHDKQRAFYLGEAVEARYWHDPNVDVDNSPRPQKYWYFGQNLVGFIHNSGRGHQGRKRLLTLMQQDEPILWSKTRFHEWHMGDIHHKKVIELTSEEDIQGIKLKWLRTLMPPDAWENEEFFRSLKGAEAHLWNYDQGLLETIHFNCDFRKKRSQDA